MIFSTAEQLEGDGPARGARARSGGLLVGREVRLDDDPVDAERQLGAQARDVLDPREHLLDGVDGEARDGRRGRCVDAERGRAVHQFAVGQGAQRLGVLGRRAGQGQQAVREERHRHRVGALLGPECARRGVPRVGEGGAAVVRTHLVRVLELADRHEDFAPHLDRVRLGEAVGQALDGADRVRDVLPGRPVAPGDQLREAPLVVARGDGQPVQLGLDVPPGHLVADPAGNRRGPGGELLTVEHVVQAQHRDRVRHVPLDGTAPDLAGRRVRQHLVGVVRLVRGDGPHEPVVRVVVEGGRPARVVGARRQGRVRDGLGVGSGVGQDELTRSRCHAAIVPGGTDNRPDATAGPGSGAPAHTRSRSCACTPSLRPATPNALPRPWAGMSP